ncbi:hypothetical protein HKX48_000394 [Thoreauomyces humboldtii]|nr:hypothetical protein HKX48_000394 [Thoreauomyces humboldtii]
MDPRTELLILESELEDVKGVLRNEKDKQPGAELEESETQALDPWDLYQHDLETRIGSLRMALGMQIAGLKDGSAIEELSQHELREEEDRCLALRLAGVANPSAELTSRPMSVLEVREQDYANLPIVAELVKAFEAVNESDDNDVTGVAEDKE